MIPHQGLVPPSRVRVTQPRNSSHTFREVGRLQGKDPPDAADHNLKRELRPY
jgi:hypothetical protein